MATKAKSVMKKTQPSKKSPSKKATQGSAKKATSQNEKKQVTKSAVKTSSKVQNKPSAKSVSKTAAKSSVKPSAKSSAKTTIKASAKSPAKSKVKSTELASSKTAEASIASKKEKGTLAKEKSATKIKATSKSTPEKITATNLTVVAEVLSETVLAHEDVEDSEQRFIEIDQDETAAPTALTSKGKSKSAKVPKVKAEPKKKELTMKQRFPSTGTSSLDVFKGRSKSRPSTMSRSESAPVYIDPEDEIPKEAGAQNKKWASLHEKHKSKNAAPYRMTESYEAKTTILHKVLGWGYIISKTNDRLEVLFKDGIRQLISNYKAPEPIKD